MSQCQCRIKDGKGPRCRRRVKEGEKFCFQHKKKCLKTIGETKKPEKLSGKITQNKKIAHATEKLFEDEDAKIKQLTEQMLKQEAEQTAKQEAEKKAKQEA